MKKVMIVIAGLILSTQAHARDYAAKGFVDRTDKVLQVTATQNATTNEGMLEIISSTGGLTVLNLDATLARETKRGQVIRIKTNISVAGYENTKKLLLVCTGRAEAARANGQGYSFSIDNVAALTTSENVVTATIGAASVINCP
jgi:hypothetical protein